LRVPAVVHQAVCHGPQCQQHAVESYSVVVSESVVVQPSPVAAASPPAGQAAGATGDRAEFRRVFLRAIKAARGAGQLDLGQSMLLSFASRNPRVMDELQASFLQSAQDEGYIATTGAIDWEAFLNFLQQVDWDEVLEFVMTLIKLFS